MSNDNMNRRDGQAAETPIATQRMDARARAALTLLTAAASEALAVISKIRPAGHGHGTEVRLRQALDAVTACRLDVAGNAAPELSPGGITAWRAVVRERRRQIAEEGWTPEHDDTHAYGQLAQAAATYAAAAALDEPEAAVMRGYGAAGTPRHILAMWPWDMEWWKPKDHRSNLVRAGALILADLERIDRAAFATGESHG